jgi:hypothetical protein
MSLSNQSGPLGPALAVDQTSGLPFGSRLSTGVAMSDAGSRPRVTVAGRVWSSDWLGRGPPVEVGTCVTVVWGPPVEVATCALARRGLRRVGALGRLAVGGPAARRARAAVLAAVRASALASATLRVSAWSRSVMIRAGVGRYGYDRIQRATSVTEDTSVAPLAYEYLSR